MEDLVTKMAEACARVTAAIDLDDALQAVVDEARDICRAQYGVLVAFENTGEITDIITSGFTQTELKRLWSPPNGWRLLEDLNRIEHPIRVTDLPAYAKSSGLFDGDLPARSFLGSRCAIRECGSAPRRKTWGSGVLTGVRARGRHVCHTGAGNRPHRR